MGRTKSLTDNQAEQELTRALNESGMKDTLRIRFMENLNDAGWREMVKLVVLDYIHEKGIDSVNVEDCVQATSIKARSLVPDHAVKDLQQEIQKFIEEKAEQ